MTILPCNSINIKTMIIPFETIDNIDDVKRFFLWLKEDLHLLFHPDFLFEDYIEKDRKPVFSKEECTLLNHLMDECFKVCETGDVEIYSIGLEVQTEYNKRHPYISYN